VSQKVALDKVTFPAGAKNLIITKVRMKARRPLVGGGPFTIGVHLPASAGASLPGASPVGTPGAVPLADIPLAFDWVRATFTDVTFAAPVSEIVVVAKGPAANAAYLQYLNSAAAPVDTYAMRWTTNSGSSWGPAPAQEKDYDAPVEVWGTYETGGTATIITDTYFLTAVGVSIDPSSGAGGAVRTVARVLNQPEVPGP
jgi:hypothetical protein